MWSCRTLFCVLLASPALFLAAAVGQQEPAKAPAIPAPTGSTSAPATPVQPPVAPPGSAAPAPGFAPGAQTAPGMPAAPAMQPPPKADPDATKVLHDAVQRLDWKKLGWVDTAFWQRADVQGLSFQAEGKYLSAPERRFRLDLRVRLGGTVGKLEVVSDGGTLWEGMKIGSFPPRVSKLDLTKVLEELKGPAADVDPLRDEFFQTQSFRGIAPLLSGIEQRMTVTGQEKVRRDGKDMTRLTAVWSQPLQAGMQWPAFLPRQCQLYLASAGSDNLPWPYRVEWWGPAAQPGSEALLYAMEFRDPKINQPLPNDQAARTFKYEPGTDKVEDQTEAYVQQYKMRLQQMAAEKQQKTATPATAGSPSQSTAPSQPAPQDSTKPEPPKGGG